MQMRYFSNRPMSSINLSYDITGSKPKCHNDSLGLKLVYLWIFNDISVIFHVFSFIVELFIFPLFQHILKELKYATHKNSTVTSVFDVLVTFLLELSCRLLVTCGEMRKRHFIDKINVKTSKSMEKAICDINVGAMLKMSNFVYVWLNDVDLIFKQQ